MKHANSIEQSDCYSSSITRQTFLRLVLNGTATLSFAAAGLRFGIAEAMAQAPATVEANVIEVAHGVFVHQGRHGVYAPDNGGDICNTGFIIGDDAVAVVDTGGTALLGAALKARISTLTDRPVRYVINTHMHPDHVLGNAAFKADGCQFVGHEKLAPALLARAERYLAYNKAAVGEKAFAGTEIVLPTVGVADHHEIDLGGRTLALLARATAHTDNDLTVRDEKTGTLFTGDLIFSGHVPTLDGSIRGWLKLLAELEPAAAERIVPGHGPAAMNWHAASAPVKRYLEVVAAGVRAAIASGRTMRDAIETVGESERANWQLFDEFHRRNVSAAFAELEWE